MKYCLFALACCHAVLWSQEAGSGFEVHGTVSALAAYSNDLASSPRDGAALAAGLRAMLYPTLKISEHWSISGAIQLHTRPYFREEFETQGYGVKADILQLNLTYSRFWKRGSFVFRTGQLSPAFGSFLLRYDDAANPLIDMPLSYGYYGKGVTNYGLVGAQVDGTAGKFDMRAQFVNSSPANRRSIFDHDQYGAWIGGVGYTIFQGLRVGASVYRGPYLDRHSPFYFPGEAKPRDLPATAAGIDVQWAHGPWNAYGEWQRFRFDYQLIPVFTQQIGYAELRRVLHPRWYVAARAGYSRSNEAPAMQVYETAVGYRPNRYQLIKTGYEILQGPGSNAFMVQLVTTFRPISIAHD